MNSVIDFVKRYPVAIAVIVVIVIIIIWSISSGNSSAAIDEHMTGCWVAPDDFCESAEIGSMMCVFDKPSAGWLGGADSREGYIVILPNGVKSPMNMKYVSCKHTDQYECEIRAIITFDDGPDWGTEPVSLRIDMRRGAMTISGERDGVKTVYARLYRQNDISDLVTGIMTEDSNAIALTG